MLTNVNTITLAPDTTTMKFKDYGGEDKLYISYKFKENEKVGLYLQLDSGLVNSDKSINLNYKASFTVDGALKELTSSASSESIKVRDFADEGKVGATVFGSYALVLSAEDSFKEAVTQNLTSTMKLIVQSEV